VSEFREVKCVVDESAVVVVCSGGVRRRQQRWRMIRRVIHLQLDVLSVLGVGHPPRCLFRAIFVDIVDLIKDGLGQKFVCVVAQHASAPNTRLTSCTSEIGQWLVTKQKEES
jgi:hypothetical protein